MENQENLTSNQNQKTDYLLPLSVIIAAALIAGAWIYTSGVKNISQEISGKNGAEENQIISAPNIENIKPVSQDDHISGNPNAEIIIIEYSDLECPFCKVFHETMKRVISEYNGKVAWVYRHFPLEQRHLKAKKAAIASECAAELGGNDKFWQYIDRYFEITPSNDGINLLELPNIAEYIGLNKTEFNNCLNSDKYNQKIKEQIKNAADSGARGTPYSVAISKNGKKYPIDGAYPYEDVKAIIEEALK